MRIVGVKFGGLYGASAAYGSLESCLVGRVQINNGPKFIHSHPLSSS
jgi:hypothetical protein